MHLQNEQLAAPLEDQVPELQVRHDACESPPLFLDHVPALQATHDVDPMLDHVPALQIKHEASPLTDHVPALQGVHTLASVAS